MDPANKDLYQIILIGAGILVAILVYFVVAIIRQQRKVYHWQQDRIAAEITTLENERKRIAADLHDELGPVLSAVRLQINHLEPEDETEKMVLARSTSQIDEVIQRFREISYDLMPNTLLRKGLSRAVEEFAEKMQLANGLNINFSGEEQRMQPEKELNVFRIVQEIVHNTIKHARAGSLVIELRFRNNKMLLYTKDDGLGFDYREKEQRGGLGLLNLQSRVALLKGNLQLDTQPGKGTVYNIEIPV
ncbi:MAG: sensor histidine kinase [Chitinophagaceae bacterium]|nr:sensor histidine kinase [Chitinophagaceae bacterium]